MGADTPEVTVGTVEGGLYIGMLGRATQRTCPTADQLVSDYLSSRPDRPVVVLDVTGCDWIDSTFAGWLIQAHKRLGRAGGGRLLISGCGERCRRSLEKMRLAELLEFQEFEPPEELQPVSCTTGDAPGKDELKLMLEAHEALAGVSPENEQVFTPIATMLRGQLESS
jgi:anti-anti-sigma regulatory factor